MRGAEGAKLTQLRKSGYSPELNRAEHVGSMLKMATANRVFETLPEMEAAIEQEMRPLWNTPARVHSLIGDNAVHSQTNASAKKQTSGFQLELVSVDFYESREAGIGLEFEREAREAIQEIQIDPQRFPAGGKGARRLVMQRFPFIIHFAELPDAIWILAFAHTSRKPGYWRRRL